MASDLLSIAVSGAKAARSALDVTAQNIANASTTGYVRRTIGLSELSSSGGLFLQGDITLSGVRVSGIDRNADLFLQAEARRTQSDATRGSTELSGLTRIESAIEQAGVFGAIVEFEASLRQLESNPADSSLRAATLAAADAMANSFNIANQGLASAGEVMRFESQAAVDEANLLAMELGRVNLRLARTGPGTSDRATLLDQRDNLLAQLGTRADIKASFASDGTVTIQFGSDPAAILVQGGNAGTIAMTTNADGTVDFTLNGSPASPGGGTLAGNQLALTSLAASRARLDSLATGIAATVNTAQANGVALDGSAGMPLFAGTGAGNLSLALASGSGIATAPAGAGAGSINAANLAALRAALENNGHAADANALLFGISSQVASRKVTSEALGAIASLARIRLDEQSGVDLDQEAANLVRYQQAFEANGRAMQVASNIFDTLLGIGR